jgi:hypothetical protein
MEESGGVVKSRHSSTIEGCVDESCDSTLEETTMISEEHQKEFEKVGLFFSCHGNNE